MAESSLPADDCSRRGNRVASRSPAALSALRGHVLSLAPLAVIGLAVWDIAPRPEGVDEHHGQSASASAPDLQGLIDPAELSLGEVWEQPAFPWKLTVRNPRDEPLRITRVSSRCDCTLVGASSLVVEPRREEVLDLQINLLSASGRLPYEFASDVLLTLEGGRTLPVLLKAQVVPSPFQPEVDDLDLGVLRTGTADSEDRRIRVRTDAAAPMVRVEFDSEIFESVQWEPADDEPHSHQIKLQMRRDASPGELSTILTLRTDGDGIDSAH